MSVDRSLRIQSSLSRHRNVLTRAERVAAMQQQERFGPDDGALGLPKLGNRKPKAGKKAEKKEEGAEAAAPAKGGKK